MKNDETLSFGRRYSELRSLGSGAQGVVYVGKDRFLGGNLVAIKALRPKANDEWRKAFIHEFEVLAGLSHQRLARVHDFGSTEDGRVYFTRDYVEGRDLRAATANMDAPSLLGAIIEVCRALKPLHSRGLLHGDLKPGNIILADDGVAHLVSKDGVAHLIDFSFVCATGDDAKRQGTVQYMAPEVIEGKPVDPRADLYALGITIVDIMFGEPPFNGKVSEIVSGHLGDERPDLKIENLRFKVDKGDQLLGGILRIARRLISRNPDDRFPDVWEVEAALKALADDSLYPDPMPDYPVVSDPLGRETEFKRVRKAVEDRLNKPDDGGGLHVVLGEFGTGKQALLMNIKWWAELNDVAVVEARSATGLLEPIARLVDQALDYIQSDSVKVSLGEHLVEQLSKPDVASANLDSLTRETVRLLTDVAKKTGLVVEICDVEQASPETIRVLCGILASIGPSLPMAVVVAAEPPFDWQEKLGQGESYTLPVLETEQIKRLTAAFLGRADPNVVDRITSHTGGNPLFVEALLKDLAASGEGAERLEQLGPPRRLEEYWRDRLETMTRQQRSFLESTAILDRAVTLDEIAHVADMVPSGLENIALVLEDAGWIRRGSEGWHMATAPLAKEVISTLDSSLAAKYHEKASQIEPSEARKLLHCAKGNQLDIVKSRGLVVAKSLERVGALHAAIELLTEMRRAVKNDDEIDSVNLSLGNAYLAQGSYKKAKERLLPLARQKRDEIRCPALLSLARIHKLYGDLDESAACLEQVLETGNLPAETARAYTEFADLEYRRGNLGACVTFAEQGLECAPPRDPVRAELLVVLAKEAAQGGRHESGLARAREAVGEARLTGDKVALAGAMEILAWVLGQAGNHKESIREIERIVALYRETGNLSKLMNSNLSLGDMKWHDDNWSEALAHYEEAWRLTTAVSNPVSTVAVAIGLGQALVKVGRFERAKSVIDAAEQGAVRLKQEELRIIAVIYRGALLTSCGEMDRGIELYREAHISFKNLVSKASDAGGESKKSKKQKTGWLRRQTQLADLESELAGWYLWRNGPGDRELARALIDTASARESEEEGQFIEEKIALQRGALAISEGQIEVGIECLDELCDAIDGKRAGDIRWQARFLAAGGYLELNSDFLARKRARQAEKDLENLSKGFDSQQKISFWQDVRRTEVRKLIETTAPSSDFSSTLQTERSSAKLSSETRALYRVLEFNQQLSVEHELPRLLEAILEAAVELTEAERGLLLMVSQEGEGTLDIRAVKHLESKDLSDPHERFSKSIAESVHLDGEPVVTIDAMGDQRFSEFISIHELKLKSVACVPVRYRGHGLGVLYLENRFKTGRFDGSDLRVLSAFSDQVAIAISQTRHLEEAKRREMEIRGARRALEEAYQKQTESLNSKSAHLKLTNDRLERLREHVQGQGNYHGAIGTGENMSKVFSMMERIKDLDVPVVFIGESGTGKDLLARILHDEGARKEGPFIALNCGSVPETLMESTLFGHKKGAFSGASSDQSGILAAASGGTLYLDEIGDMSPRMQVDFLRVLQEERFTPLGASESVDFNLRLVVSSKAPLEELVETGRLRQDLLYRLQVVTVKIPPLRERTEDILPMARIFVEREASQSNRTKRSLCAEAADALVNHSWPGNVRQLELALRRAIIIGDHDGPISPSELGIEALESDAQSSGTVESKIRLGVDGEKARILEALERCQWNRTRAAKELGIPRRTFYRKIEKLGIVTKK